MKRVNLKKIPLNNNKGQALVEYILLLLVAAAIILGVLTQFNRSFGNWMSSYFGEYISCLLETGELPSIGGATKINSGLCNAQYEPFTLSEGRPPIKNDNKNANNSGSSESTGKKRFKANPRSSSGGGSSGAAGSERGGKGGGSFSPNNFNDGSGASSSASIRSNSENDSDEGGVSNYTQIKGLNERGKKGARSLMKTDLSVEAQKEKNNGKSKVVDKAIDEGDGSKKSKRFLATEPNKKKTQDIEIEPLSFGDYIRYLIIAAIILLLIIVLVGQGYQVKKSME